MSLEVANVTKRFGGFAAVSDFSFTVPSDGIVGLIGPNGAGKSTLFSIVSGFIAPDAGAVRFEGADVTRLSPERRARAGLARSFQVPREFPHLTVRDNLAVAVPRQTGESLRGLYFQPAATRRCEEAVRGRVDETLALIGLSPVATLKAGSLSGGQRKLLELGKLLLAEPKLMLLDEPFAGVNPVLIEAICALIRTLNRRGIGFLVVEHNIGVLTRLVDRLFVMDRGTLLAQGAAADVMRDKKVHDAYLGGTA